MGLKHSFLEKNKSAGKVWLDGFMRRTKILSLRKSEGLSLARAQGMNRKEVGDYFSLLLQVLTENDLLEHPSKIFNMDETGIQINNKPEQVIATKGSKDVYSLTSTEKGENVSVIAFCSAEGNFFPPVLIMKGKYKKPEFSEGLPPGSDVYMNQKTSYINTDLFMKWFREYFIPRKGTGKALLVLDAHASHSNAIELLDFASQNEVVLLCLSSHTTQALQPLDKSFFKRLKSYFSQETKTWMIIHKDRKLNRRNVAALIGNAWSRAATVSNGVAGFKAVGIYPYDPSVISEHLFAISDANGASGGDVIQPTQGTTSGHTLVSSEHVSPKKTDNTCGSKSSEATSSEAETPSKFFREINPVPTIPNNVSKRKQSAIILTSPEHKVKSRLVAEKKRKDWEKNGSTWPTWY
ncbi:hypothetical protein MTP99_002996 [Tenebrio molitor]|jgi:hypothetical protein|nr:hypothetical protein MTP99_002996 [Tenebrio molitor]